MPKGRFHEIYQDYLCGCVLRVAREIFALLPVDTVLLTATADSFNSRLGQTVEQAVLSVVIPRATIAGLDFERLDPSDSMENFLHRGDLKVSRKSEAFQPITPLTASDIPVTSARNQGIRELLSKAQSVREELRVQIAELTGRVSASVPQESQSL
jgi:hypothetical protein